MRLRYTGSHPTVFAYQGVALVDPGDEFWVNDRDADGFLARADIEPVDDPDAEPATDGDEEQQPPAVKAPHRGRARKSPAPASAGDETPGATEQSD